MAAMARSPALEAASVSGQESGDRLTRPGIPRMPTLGQFAPGDGEARLTSGIGDAGGRPDRGGHGGAAIHTPPKLFGLAPGGDGYRLIIIGVFRPVAHGAVAACIREPPRIHGHGTRRA